MEELNKLIGERIRKCRTDLKMSQNELAKRINRGRRTIVSWENGTEKKCPPIEALMEMCKIFNCEIGYLVGEFDCKRRMATNIHEEIGLSENAIMKLNEYNKVIIQRPLLAGRAQATIDFIDLFILNCESLMSYILEIYNARIDMNVIKNNPYYHEVKGAFEEVEAVYNWRLQGNYCAEEAFFNEVKKRICNILDEKPVLTTADKIDKMSVKHIGDYMTTYLPKAFKLLQDEKADPDGRLKLFQISDTFLDLVKQFVNQQVHM